MKRLYVAFAYLTLAAVIGHAAESAPKKEVAAAKTDSGVKLSVGQLIVLASTQTISQLMNQKLPANVAFRIYRMIDVLRPEMERVMKQRQALFTDDNSTEQKDKDGRPTGVRNVKPEKQADVQRQLDLLIKETVHIDVVPLSISEVTTAGFQLSAGEIDDLGPLITDK